MINIEYTVETKGKKYNFKRVSKKIARAAYNNGLTVVFCPCNLRPFNNYFGLDMPINRANIDCDFQTFETVLNAFEYYNCNTETGKYTAFYIPVCKDPFCGL